MNTNEIETIVNSNAIESQNTNNGKEAKTKMQVGRLLKQKKQNLNHTATVIVIFGNCLELYLTKENNENGFLACKACGKMYNFYSADDKQPQ